MAGVKDIKNHLVWVEPVSSMAFGASYKEPSEATDQPSSTRVRALWGLTFRTEYLRTYTEFVSMTTIVRCPRTGRACSEGACRERHWCRQLFERGLSHRGLPLKRKFRPRCCAKTRAGAPCIMRVVFDSEIPAQRARTISPLPSSRTPPSSSTAIMSEF